MVEVTELEEHKCQYLYRADGNVHLMDPETFDMYEVPESVLEGKVDSRRMLTADTVHAECPKPMNVCMHMSFYLICFPVLPDRQLQMLLPDMQVQLSLFQPDPDVPGKPISIKLPAQANYVVTGTQASAAQANKGTIYKNADLENGIKVQVPDFVNAGDRVVVDTEAGKYIKRA